MLPPNEAFSKARAVVAKALELDSQLAEAHTSLAHLQMHNFEWASAGREFQLALELGPNYATTHHWYAFYSLIVGRSDEVMPEIRRALELDPLSVPINTDVGELFYFNRQYDQAIEESRKALEMDPYFFRGYLHLGRIYLQQHRYQEAIAEFLKARNLGEDNPDTLAGLGQAYAMAGSRDEALDVLRELQRLAEVKYVSPYDMALVYSGLGEREQAIEWLYRAYEERAQWLIFLAVDLRLEALHSDPRFRELVERIEHRWASFRQPRQTMIRQLIRSPSCR
jgi:tetratricopeptide (TPR) repeat protein